MKAVARDLSARTTAARVAAKRSWAPHLDPEGPPSGYVPRGTSILRDGDGNVRLVWSKTTRDADPYELGEQVAAGLVAGGLEAIPELPPPSVLCEDLLSVYPLGDPHIGLYTWAAECGESFDLDIAERQYLAVASRLLPRAPLGSDALLIDLGDFFHADDPQYRTSSGRNTVDVDSRYERVVTVGIRIMATLIRAALVQHRHVTLWCLRGNHDDRSTLTLREAMRGLFASNPRVTIDATPGKHHAMVFGQSLIVASHGDTLRGKRGRTLHEIVTTDYRKEWGATTHARGYVGHVHHESVVEVGGMTTETFRTLAPKDAWHHAQGYRSGRDVRLDVWHREHGLHTRHIASMSEIQQAMEVDR